MSLESRIEAILFWKGEPISIKALSKLLGEHKTAIEVALQDLEKNLSGRGIALMIKDREVMLGTSTEAASFIESLSKEELTKDLSKPTLETLSIILYRGPISRRDIEYIRGVNSTFILRTLLIRGLIERVADEKDERIFLYSPTFELLSMLGISRLEELPDWCAMRREIEKFEAANSEEKKAEEVAESE